MHSPSSFPLLSLPFFSLFLMGNRLMQRRHTLPRQVSFYMGSLFIPFLLGEDDSALAANIKTSALSPFPTAVPRVRMPTPFSTQGVMPALFFTLPGEFYGPSFWALWYFT